MPGPLFQVQAMLLPAAHSPRLVPGWRPTISPIVKDTGGPDPAVPSLGIAFVSGPGEAQMGSAFSCSFHLLAWPDPLCDRITAGVEFAFLEGVTVVGTGKVVAVDHGHGA